MRAGANWVQHTLTPPAQSVLKHAIAEARRRGHAQVQPLHVAAMLLSHSGSGLHEASMLAGPTPLRALEVCFNVALDHLAQSGPATPSQPTLSNALVAALKRAHAHQRRGCCSEQQQPPLLAIKVELEQLIISVLDDPSVSRVIKEAGSSSAHIKGNLEDNISSCLTPSTSIGCLPSTDSIPSSRPTGKPCSKLGSSSLSMIGLPSFKTGSSHSSTTQFTSFRRGANLPLSICEQIESKDPSVQTEPVMGSSSMKLQELVEGCDKTIVGLQLNASVESQVPQVQQQKMMPDQVVQPGVEFGGRENDVCRLIEVLLRPSKRNALLVVDSDSSAHANAVVKDLAILIKMGQVPEQLCRLKVLDPQLSSVSFASCSQLDMEQKLGKLSKIVDECMPAGAVLHLGDLQWLSDPVHVKKGAVSFCPAQHAAAELERLLLRHAGSRLWFVGVATQQVFVKCQAQHPELEVQWGLQPLQVASSTSVYFSALQQLEKTAKGPDSSSPRLYAVDGKVPNLAAVKPCHGDDKIGDKLQCCAECLAKFEQERHQLHELERLSLHLAPTEWCSLSSGDALNEERLDMCSSQVKEHSVIQKLKELHRKWQETCQNVHAHLHAPVSSILKTEPSPLSKRLGNGTMADSKTRKLGSITFPPQTIQQGNSSGLLLSKKQLQGSSNLPYWAQTSPCSIGSVNSMSTAHVDGHLCTSHKRDDMVCTLDIGEPNDGSSVISASAEQEDMHGTSVTSVERGASLMSMQTDLALGRPSALTVSGSPISHSLKNTVMNCSPLQCRPQWQIHQEQMQGRTGGTSPLRGLQWQMVNSRSTELKLPPPATPALFINQGPLQALQESIADSLKGLYKALLSRVGWQGEAVAAITSTVMNCRAGMGKMRGVMSKTDSWLLFLGPDPLAKQLIAKALTEMVSGSEQNLICLGFGDQAVSRLETDDNGIRYRGRSSLDRLAEAVRMKPFSVLLLEDIDKADSVVRASLLRAMERGKLVDSSGREVSFGNVIVLMTSNIGAESLVPEHSLGGLKFSVERLVALGGGAMRLLVEDTHSDKVLFQSQSNTAVVEWGAALPNTDGANGELVHPVDGFLKRKSDGPIFQQPDPRVQVKRPKLSFSERPARALDLNLLAEENEEDSLTSGGNGQAQRDCRSSQEDESQSDEDVIKNRILGCAQDVLSDKFFGLLDHAVVFKAYDFCGLANHVLARLTKAFEGITMQGASLEVDITVLEHILAAIWRGSTVFDTWVADVVGKSVTAVLADVTIAENTVVKLVGDMGRGCIRDSSIVENNTSTGPQLPLFIEISQST